CRPDPLRAIGGFDERIVNWGGEDYDVRRRLLQTGLQLRLIPSELIQLIAHGDEERVRFYDEKDKRRSARDNRGQRLFGLDREFRMPWPDGVVFGLSGPDLMDIWRAVQYVHAVRQTRQGAVKLYPRWHGREEHDPTRNVTVDCGDLARRVAALLAMPEALEL